MKKIAIAFLSTLFLSLTAQAELTLACEVTKPISTEVVKVEIVSGQFSEAIILENGNLLDIKNFEDEFRISEIRPYSEAERNELAKNDGGKEVYHSGQVIAYSAVRAIGEVSSAMFNTQNAYVRCNVK